MPAVTATPVPDKGYVRVQVDYSDTAAATGVVLERYPTGSDLNFTTPATVRGSAPLSLYTGTAQPKPYVRLSGGKATFYDYEAPFGQSLTYATEADSDAAAWTSSYSMVANPNFITDAAGWTAFNGNSGAPTRSTASNPGTTGGPWPPSGTTSGNVKATAVGAYGAAYANMPVTAGKTYTASAVFWTHVGGRFVQMQMSFYNAAGAWLSGVNGLSVPAAADVQVIATATMTAPAGATKATILPIVAATGITAVGDDFYIWGARVSETTLATVAPTSAPVTLDPVADVGWLKDPQRPALNLKLLCGPADIAGVCDTGQGVHFVGLGGRRSAADSKNIDVPGAARGSSAYSTRKDFTSTLRVVARTLADRDALVALLASGAPLLLQLPSQYGEPDQYIQVGELAEDRLHNDHRVPWRVFTLPYTVEDSPIGQAQGPPGARWRDLSRYATWNALKASGVTWDGLGTV